jgi:hypothetical protein
MKYHFRGAIVMVKIYSEDELKTLYDTMLDEWYPSCKIGSSEFYPSQILKELDPIAYNCGLADFISNENLEIE